MEAIAGLIGSDRGRVLIVSGPPQSAVSEIPRIVERERDAGVEYATVNLEAAGLWVSAKALAETIAAHAGLDVAEMPRFEETAPARFARFFASWIVGKLEEGRTRRILTLGGFERVSVPQDASDIVIELLDRIEHSSGTLRLILLNYGKRLPNVLADQLGEITLEPVSRRDVFRFFEALFKNTGRRFDPKAVDSAVDLVFGPLQSLGSWDFDQLRSHLLNAARALSEPAS